MEKLPQHCRDNATFFQLNDYMNFELMSSGIRTRLKFNRIPNFYIIDNKGYFAVSFINCCRAKTFFLFLPRASIVSSPLLRPRSLT